MALATTMQEKRGPRIGDAASLWNFTPAPGWNKEEVQVLRLCLMKYGVGQWMAILNTGLLPGKLIQQLNGQTQRLLGQQSLAAYTGLRVDIDRIRADNETRTDAQRKAGLIINDGPNLTKEMKTGMRDEAQKKYGLTDEQLKEVDQALETLAASTSTNKVGGEGMMTKAGMAPVVDLMSCDLGDLNRDMRLQLVRRLAGKLGTLVDRWRTKKGLAPRWAALSGRQLQQAVQAPGGAVGDATDADATDGDFKENVVPRNAGNVVQPAGKPTAKPAAAAPKPRARPQAGGKDGGVKKRAAPKKRKSEAAAAGADLMLAQMQGSGSSDDEDAGPSGQDEDAMEGWENTAAQKVQGRTSGRARAPRASYAAIANGYGDDAFNPEDVQQLAAMGFSPRKAKEALTESGMSIEGAVEWLFRNCC